MSTDELYVIRADVEGGVGFYLGGQNWRSGWTPNLRKAATYSSYEEAHRVASSRPVRGAVDSLGVVVSVEGRDYGVAHTRTGRLLNTEPPRDWCGCLGIPRSPRALWHYFAGRPCRSFVADKYGGVKAWCWDDADRIANSARESTGDSWRVRALY